MLYTCGALAVYVCTVFYHPQILAHGLLMNPNAAIKSIWDVLDWFILFATFATMITYLASCGPAAQVEVGLRRLSTGVQQSSMHVGIQIV